MTQHYTEVENTDPAQHARWLAKHGFQPGEDGTFPVDSFQGAIPVSTDQLFQNIRDNVAAGWYEPLLTQPYDDRTFVMVCGGPSLVDHLEEVRSKANQPDRYLVVCSNMTGGWLLEHGITPHAHFIIDPQEKKQFDVAAGATHQDTQYWINAACHPNVFSTLQAQSIKPYIFLADFDAEGKAIQAVKDALPAGRTGMMAIQGGTMAGLRAINLADALGFRKMEYYGFDATVLVKDGRAAPYAYEKKRGEAIIEVQCDRCEAKFDTTLVFQKQVNEFIKWRAMLPWIDIKIIGGGLIAHYQKHIEELESQVEHATYLFTDEYAALQRELHAGGNYGVTGSQYTPSIFHAICQLAKRHGAISVLDYGSAAGNTFAALQQQYWLPPGVVFHYYDPFIPEHSQTPEVVDLVICADVMEHVEPQCTRAVLDHIARITRRLVFFSIALTPAGKVMSDGRNAHINLRSQEFWLREIQRRFVISEAQASAGGETLLVIGQAISDVQRTVKERKHEG